MGIKLDGFDVEVGDRLYDLKFGYGEAIRIIDVPGNMRMEMSFAESRANLLYTDAGFAPRSSRRSLYWNDPIVVIPPKSTTRWDLAARAMKMIGELLRNG